MWQVHAKAEGALMGTLLGLPSISGNRGPSLPVPVTPAEATVGGTTPTQVAVDWPVAAESRPNWQDF